MQDPRSSNKCPLRVPAARARDCSGHFSASSNPEHTSVSACLLPQPQLPSSLFACGHIAPASKPLHPWTCHQHAHHVPSHTRVPSNPDPSLSAAHEPTHPHLFSSPRIPSQSSILAAATVDSSTPTALFMHMPRCHRELDRALHMTASTTHMAKVRTVRVDPTSYTSSTPALAPNVLPIHPRQLHQTALQAWQRGCGGPHTPKPPPLCP